jgi:predicted regulator of Ras-like GTPase activity (Roadblock/LC7/MglB family)
MFKELLKEIVCSVDGAAGAVIMGMDGISVEEYAEHENLDLQLIGIELSTVVKEMNRAAISMDTGPMGEMMMVNREKTVIARKINDDYFVALVLNGTGNLGKGRFKLRILVPRMASEFE